MRSRGFSVSMEVDVHVSVEVSSLATILCVCVQNVCHLSDMFCTKQKAGKLGTGLLKYWVII